MPISASENIRNTSSFLLGSFVHRLKRSFDNESVEVLLVQGENPQGESCYAYVAIVASLIHDFQLTLKIRTTNPEDYGVILASGNDQPDDDIQNYIAENFLSS